MPIKKSGGRSVTGPRSMCTYLRLSGPFHATFGLGTGTPFPSPDHLQVYGLDDQLTQST